MKLNHNISKSLVICCYEQIVQNINYYATYAPSQTSFNWSCSFINIIPVEAQACLQSQAVTSSQSSKFNTMVCKKDFSQFSSFLLRNRNLNIYCIIVIALFNKKAKKQNKKTFQFDNQCDEELTVKKDVIIQYSEKKIN